MARIFISYSRADTQFVKDFIPLLRRVYNSVWFDDDIHGGADWWQMILAEINECELFIYLISNDSLNSPYCQAEFQEALRLKKQILPIVIRRLSPPYPGAVEDALATELNRIQYVDLSGGINNAETISRTYAAITKLLNLLPSEPPIPRTSMPVDEPPVPDKKSSQFLNLNLTILITLALLSIIIILISLNFDQFLPRSPLSTEVTEDSVVQAPDLTLFVEEGILTLYVSSNEPVSLEGFQFQVMQNGELTTFSPIIRFRILEAQSLILDSGTCLVYRFDQDARIPEDCVTNLVQISAVSRGDRFWLDDNNNRVTIFFLQNGESFGQPCGQLASQCPISSHNSLSHINIIGDWEVPNQAEVLSLSWNSDGRVLGVLDASRFLSIWDLFGVLQGDVLAQREFSSAIDWHPFNNAIATGGCGPSIKIWEQDAPVTATTLLHISEAPFGCTITLDIDPTGEFIASIDEAGHLRIQGWSNEQQEIVRTLSTLVNDMKWNNDGSQLALVEDTGALRIFDVEDFLLINSLFRQPLRTIPLNSLAWSPDGSLIATASDSGWIAIWETEDNNILADTPFEGAYLLEEHSAAVIDIDWHPEENWLVSIGLDNRIIVWDALTGFLMAQIEVDLTPTVVEWIPNTPYFSIGDTSGTVTLYSVNDSP